MGTFCQFCSLPILTQFQSKVLAFVENHNEVTAKKVSSELEMSIQHANNVLTTLVLVRLLDREKKGRVFEYFKSEYYFK